MSLNTYLLAHALAHAYLLAHDFELLSYGLSCFPIKMVIFFVGAIVARCNGIHLNCCS